MQYSRRRYYDLFSHFYDMFIALHSLRDEQSTREILVDSAQLEGIAKPYILDICCGTGSLILTFAKRYPKSTAVGLDFSHGMLRKAKKKNPNQKALFIEADAALLPFSNDIFDVVACSYALYELKGAVRTDALKEMKRVVKPGQASVLIMEHEAPKHPIVRFLFKIRMILVGSTDVRALLGAGLEPFKKIFSKVHLLHTPSGKSRLLRCIK
ncbi:MAG: methyltransferase domain-containing protein [Deltaproteobacteria bacterium]|nr:methyltransferase domain-containing protein [Deltaproteobacteria bacterium]MBW2151300.1 methyltransferase domain-containing protein [Deltaproteobacteria bacterium]